MTGGELDIDHVDDEATARRLIDDHRIQRAQIRGTPPAYLTDWQRSVIESPYKHTVAWGANGIGKSMVIAEITRRAIAGALHWQRPRQGRTVMLVGNTWSQLGSTLAYLWKFTDKRWFRDGLRFEGGRMMGQRLAIFDIVDGPGKGGVLRCGTFRAENLAGPRAETVITDEPLPEDVYNELWPRLLGENGRMYQTFTPTLGTEADLSYLWAQVDDPAVDFCGQIQGELTLSNVTPRRPPGPLPSIPWMTAREIAQQVAGLSAMEVDMRLGRSRHPRLDCAYFSAWGPHLIEEAAPTPGARVAIGIDHGSAPGRQRSTLVAVAGHGLHARVWVLGHHQGDGRTESQDDARGILRMLDTAGLSIDHVDLWVGDRAHGGDRRGGYKSNQRLRAAIAEAMGYDTSSPGWMSRLPRPLQYIETPRKYARSHLEGAEVLHRLMVAKRLRVDPSAAPLIRDFERWQGDKLAPEKDGIDSARYAAVGLMEQGDRR